MQYAELDTADLEREAAALFERYWAVSGSNLSLDLTRGKPAPDQLDLSNALDGILGGEYISESGIDTRNYGDLRGLPEARELGAEILGLDAEQIIAAGPSSLTLMYQVMDAAFHYGLSGPGMGRGRSGQGNLSGAGLRPAFHDHGIVRRRDDQRADDDGRTGHGPR